MRKIGLVCVALLMAGCLAGCGNQSKSSSKGSAKISSLKAENSSLKKAAKTRKHKVKQHQSSSASQGKDSNDNMKERPTTQVTRNSSANASQIAKANNVKHSRNDSGQQAANQSSGDSRTGDWHHDPELWDAAQNNDEWQGSMYQNVSPQGRYNYIEDNHDYWASRDPNYYNE